MVFLPNGRGGGWHEPPYTWEEEMDFYRRFNGPWTIYRSQRPGAAGKPAQATEQQRPEGK